MNIFNILTIYPDFFKSFYDHGLIKKGLEKKLISFNILDIRKFTSDKHNRVDFKTYGGGPGMVLQYQPIKDALNTIKNGKCYLLSPQGKALTQNKLNELSKEKEVTFICGRYEGIDERIIESYVDEEWSIGDYVVSGGELPVMSMIDATVRLLPGVLGHKDSAAEDSFFQGLLDCPHYTRPEDYQGRPVPSVLLSGHHAEIRRWRLKQALGRTWQRRPDLLHSRPLSKEEQQLLNEYKGEHGLS